MFAGVMDQRPEWAVSEAFPRSGKREHGPVEGLAEPISQSAKRSGIGSVWAASWSCFCLPEKLEARTTSITARDARHSRKGSGHEVA